MTSAVLPNAPTGYSESVVDWPLLRNLRQAQRGLVVFLALKHADTALACVWVLACRCCQRFRLWATWAPLARPLAMVRRWPRRRVRRARRLSIKRRKKLPTGRQKRQSIEKRKNSLTKQLKRQPRSLEARQKVRRKLTHALRCRTGFLATITEEESMGK